MEEDMLYFDPEVLPVIQVDLLLQILGTQRAAAILMTDPDKLYTIDMFNKLADEQRNIILKQLYIQYGKTPDV